MTFLEQSPYPRHCERSEAILKIAAAAAAASQ